MLSGKRPAPAAVNFFYFFLIIHIKFCSARRDMITMMVPDCAIVLFVRLLTKRQRQLNQGLARKEMVLGGQNLQEQLNHLRMLR